MEVKLYFKKITSVASLTIFTAALLLSSCKEKDSPVENAAQELSDGIENAKEELDVDRTIVDKVGDSIEDLGEEIQDVGN